MMCSRTLSQTYIHDTGRSVIGRLTLISLFEDWRNICLFPASRAFPCFNNAENIKISTSRVRGSAISFRNLGDMSFVPVALFSLGSLTASEHRLDELLSLGRRDSRLFEGEERRVGHLW